jgi:hypothetical protein
LVIVLLHNLSFPASAFAATRLLLDVDLDLIAIRLLLLLLALFVRLVGLWLVFFLLLLHAYLLLLGFAKVTLAPVAE